MTKETVTILAAVLTAIAAGLWMASTLVKVSAEEAGKPNAQGWRPAQIISGGSDVFATSRKQAKWNQRAAFASCLAAAAQAWALFIPAA